MNLGELADVLRGPDAVFVHDAVDTPQDQRDDHASRRVFFHDTYVGAVNTALRLGLVSKASRDLVARDAAQAVDAIGWETPDQQQRVRPGWWIGTRRGSEPERPVARTT